MEKQTNNRAKQGDTIRIIIRNSIVPFGTQMIVIKTPQYSNFSNNIHKVWVEYGGTKWYVNEEWYELVNQDNTQENTITSCSKGVDVHLKQQMDDNLRSIFQ